MKQSFINYLISKKLLTILFLLINSFAVFVNVNKIYGEYKTKNKCNETLETTNYFLTSYNNTFNGVKSQFWPFVDFFQHSNDELPPEGMRWCSNSFKGIFYSYDYSEFLAYSVLFIVILFISWNIKTNKK